MLGLIGRDSLRDGEGMLFERCRAIHTFFMRTPIDVLFLDEHYRIVRVIENLRPWRPLVACASASRVVELAAGSVSRLALRVGDRVRIDERAA